MPNDDHREAARRIAYKYLDESAGRVRAAHEIADALQAAAQAQASRVEKLEKDQQDWRNGVELIASALGEKNPPNLSCVRLSEVALELRARVEKLEAATNELIHAVGKLALESGEQWRLEHPEIMDAYQAIQALGG